MWDENKKNRLGPFYYGKILYGFSMSILEMYYRCVTGDIEPCNGKLE